MPNKRLPASAFKAIRREHLLRAIQDLDQGVEHGFADSTGFDLIHADKHYPPKAVFGVAGRYALGKELLPEHFSAGENTPCFKILRNEGFEVVPSRGPSCLHGIRPTFQRRNFWKSCVKRKQGMPQSGGVSAIVKTFHRRRCRVHLECGRLWWGSGSRRILLRALSRSGETGARSLWEDHRLRCPQAQGAGVHPDCARLPESLTAAGDPRACIPGQHRSQRWLEGLRRPRGHGLREALSREPRSE